MNPLVCDLRSLGCALLLAILAGHGGSSMAAEESASRSDRNPGQNPGAAASLARYAASDFSLAVVAVPRRLLRNIEAEPLLKPLLAAGARRFGFDLADLISLSMFTSFGRDGSLQTTGIVYRSSAAIRPENLLQSGSGTGRVTKGAIDGKPCFYRDGPGKDYMTACLFDERTAVVSLESGVRCILRGAKPESLLSALLGNIGDEHDLVVAAVVPPLRPAIRRLHNAIASDMPKQVLRYFKLADLTEQFTFQVDFFGDQSTVLTFRSPDATAAEEVLGFVRDGHKDVVSFVAREAPDAVDKLLGNVEISRSADRVTVRCQAGRWIFMMLTVVVEMTNRPRHPAQDTSR